MTHTCVGKTTIIGSDDGLSPGRRQAIIWTNAGILLFGTLGTNFSKILIECHSCSFKKMHMKMSSGKWRPSCLGLNVLIGYTLYAVTPAAWVPNLPYLIYKLLIQWSPLKCLANKVLMKGSAWTIQSKYVWCFGMNWIAKTERTYKILLFLLISLYVSFLFDLRLFSIACIAFCVGSANCLSHIPSLCDRLHYKSLFWKSLVNC